MSAPRARQSRTQTPSVESGDRRGAVRLPRGVRAAPFSRHSEHAHDPTRHHFRGLHAAPERARLGARPPGRGPTTDDRLGPARFGEIDDRPAGRGSRPPPVRRRPGAPSRPRRLEGHPLARRRRPHPLGAAGVPAAVGRHRPVAHQPGGASVRRSDGPGGPVSARPRPEGRRVRASRGRLADCLRQPRDRPRRRAPHADAAQQPLRPSRDPGRPGGLAGLGRGERHRSGGPLLHHLRARPPSPVRFAVERARVSDAAQLGIREQTS